MTLRAIDISHFQGTPNFTIVKGQGVALVFNKATQGTGFRDPVYALNRRNEKAVGLTPGSYHFAQGGDPTSEANFFCDTVGVLAPGELVALDWEISHPNPVQWSLAWLNVVQQRLGVKPGLYINKSTLTGFDWTPVAKADYWLWLASYDYDAATVPNVPFWPFVAIKQYSDKGAVAGVGGQVDLDTFEGNATALARYGKAGVPVISHPAPSPVPPRPLPKPAPAFNVLGWRATQGATGVVYQHLQEWGNRMFPAYCHISPVAPSYGPQTSAFLAELCKRMGIKSDGKDIGPLTASALYKLGFRG